ncbi:MULTISPECIES: dephospho-CoA kinase [unclassified Aeromicrobium]|uniref:dephospho-CoA kinase n=1 Tax=unclassified Aeromicrobium TaxID=2633570 RepID=UPI0006FD6857|nr:MULTISPECIES: dephospho-CoA kinase [unclassified Aeromicrobium]KQP26372.1 dephospho-CoA kinase [Aeromicrobium sp. Leaf272]KQP76042.1 dephospho-CoA kinase [Aeromicrobium sp. Leaf289]
MTLQVGLTGGIGSGKSTVSARLSELGAVVVDYDLLAREAVEPGSTALAAIGARFGDDVIAPDGTLDRPALGSVVFADEQARRDLEAITHPAIRELAAARVAQAPAESVVVHDHPLLVEMGMAGQCDTVVVVDVPTDVQVERLVEQRGMTEADARARLAAQTSREERLAVADEVLDNSGTREQLLDAVDALWERLAG